MVSKKYTVLLALLLTLQVASFAQTSGWDWKDSSVVPVKSLTQYNEFMQNKNPFPAKPRNAWELGFSIGESNVFGDVTPKLGVGVGITLRKAVSNVFSLRAGYSVSYNRGKGADYSYTDSAFNWNGGYQAFYRTHDYRNLTMMGSVDGIVSLNTFSNYRGDPTINVYGLGGLNLIGSQTSFKADNGNYYWLRAFERKNLLPITAKYGHVAWFLGYSFGGGVAFKLNKKVNVGIEDRITAPLFNFDYIDGQKGGQGRDVYNYLSFRLNINLLK